MLVAKVQSNATYQKSESVCNSISCCDRLYTDMPFPLVCALLAEERRVVINRLTVLNNFIF